MGLGGQHVGDDLLDLRRGLATRGAVGAVGDDEGDGAARDAVVFELLRLGEDGREDDGGLVVERGHAHGVVVRGVHGGDAGEGRVGVEDGAVQVPGVGDDAVALLGVLEGVDDEVVTSAYSVRVLAEADRARVVDEHGDQHDFACGDVVDGDAEAGGDVGADVGDVEGHDGGGGERAVVGCGVEEGGDVCYGGGGHGELLWSDDVPAGRIEPFWGDRDPADR